MLLVNQIAGFFKEEYPQEEFMGHFNFDYMKIEFDT